MTESSALMASPEQESQPVLPSAPHIGPPPVDSSPWRVGNVARAALAVLAVWFGLKLFWAVNSLVFLVFLATLFGLAVAKGVDHLERWKIRRGVGSALIVFGTLGLIGGGLAWTAPTLVEQGRELQQEFPAAVKQLQRWVDSKRGGLWGSLLKGASTPAVAPAASPISPTVSNAPAATLPTAAPTGSPPQSDFISTKLTGALTGASKYFLSFVSNTIAVFGAFVLMVFLSIYIGAEPEVYRGWLLSTVPASSRAYVRIVLREISKVLRKWLVTQLIAMVAIGTASTVILLLLGVKAPYALGFIAGLLEFIPTVGPVLSAVPAIIMGFVDSPEKAATVLVAYWGIQFVENNLLIPFLMRGEMDLPPAITLIAQALMTLVFGFVGLMVAVPLTAAVLVPLRMIAERENERERALHRAARQSGTDQSDSRPSEDDRDADGDGGMRDTSPYTRLPSTTATLKRQS